MNAQGLSVAPLLACWLLAQGLPAADDELLALFGDVATELLVRLDGDEGLFRAYDAVEFLAPVHAGDFLEVEGEIVRVGSTSRFVCGNAGTIAGSSPITRNPLSSIRTRLVSRCGLPVQ